MKKILSMVLIAALALALTACSGGSSAANIEGTLPDIMTKLIDNVETDTETKDWLKGSMQGMEIPADNVQYYLGEGDYKFKESYAYEPMMTSQAFSLVLLRAEDAAAATKLAEGVKTTVDPQKWICVGVDPADVKTVTNGDLMLLVMADNSQIYVDAFNKLAK